MDKEKHTLYFSYVAAQSSKKNAESQKINKATDESNPKESTLDFKQIEPIVVDTTVEQTDSSESQEKGS